MDFMLNEAIETQEECTFRAKVYGVMGTFSKSTVRGGQMSRKGKKGRIEKPDFAMIPQKKTCHACFEICRPQLQYMYL